MSTEPQVAPRSYAAFRRGPMRLAFWGYVVIVTVELGRALYAAYQWHQRDALYSTDRVIDRALQVGYYLCMLATFAVLGSETAQDLTRTRQRWCTGFLGAAVLLVIITLWRD